MARWYPALTAQDTVTLATLAATVLHLDWLARSGCWTAACDRLSDRLGFYGLGRN